MILTGDSVATNDQQTQTPPQPPAAATDPSGKLVIKAQLGDDIRRLSIHNEEITYDELVLMMQRIFRGRLRGDDEVTIKYRDEDGDLVTIFDSADLSFAAQGGRVLRLTLFVNDRPRLESGQVRYLRYLAGELVKLIGLLDSMGTAVVAAPATSDEPVVAAATDGQPSAAEETAEGKIVATAVTEAQSSFDPLNKQVEVIASHNLVATSDVMSVFGLSEQQQQQQQRQMPTPAPAAAAAAAAGLFGPVVEEQHAGTADAKAVVSSSPPSAVAQPPPPPPPTQQQVPPQYTGVQQQQQQQPGPPPPPPAMYQLQVPGTQQAFNYPAPMQSLQQHPQQHPQQQMQQPQQMPQYLYRQMQTQAPPPPPPVQGQAPPQATGFQCGQQQQQPPPPPPPQGAHQQQQQQYVTTLYGMQPNATGSQAQAHPGYNPPPGSSANPPSAGGTANPYSRAYVQGYQQPGPGYR